MNKLIAKTAASNIFSVVPVVGDMAGIALAISGTIELCSMLKELESTPITYGLDLHLYTDTTCEKSDLIWEGIIRQAEVRKKYWADFMRWLLE
jgi:hypothetical protein